MVKRLELVKPNYSGVFKQLEYSLRLVLILWTCWRWQIVGTRNISVRSFAVWKVLQNTEDSCLANYWKSNFQWGNFWRKLKSWKYIDSARESLDLQRTFKTKPKNMWHFNIEKLVKWLDKTNYSTVSVWCFQTIL